MAWRFFCWGIVIIYSTIPAWWLAIHPFARYWRSWQRSPYRALVPLWFAMWIAAGAITWPWRKELLYSTPWAFIASALLLMVSVPIYRRMRPEFGPQNYVGQTELRPKEFEQKLITAGMHARIRHPIYLAHLCTIAAFSVGSGMVVNFYLLAFAIVTGFVMIKTEERELEARFGEQWRNYKFRVPAIIPSVRRTNAAADPLPSEAKSR